MCFCCPQKSFIEIQFPVIMYKDNIHLTFKFKFKFIFNWPTNQSKLATFIVLTEDGCL